jgi:hypothetical protein
MAEENKQERHHVETVPGESAAPEIVADPIRPEPGATVQQDDINIHMVASSVAVAAILLLVLVVALQAWFYNAEAAETAAKTRPPEDLVALRAAHGRQLRETAWVQQPTNIARIPIDRAMQMVIPELQAGAGAGATQPATQPAPSH